jgi:hypothetical protein
VAKRLFKYVADEAAVLAIARGSLKFTPVAELNDPMEVYPFFDEQEVLASLLKLRREGCSEEQLHWLRCQRNLLDVLAPEMFSMPVPDDAETADAIYRWGGYEHLPLLRKLFEPLVQTLRSRVGILSLSERPDSFSMWAHYANDAKGFLVIFEGLESHFTGDDTGSLNLPKPVQYFETPLGMTFEAETQDRLFFGKLAEWAPEREWRVVRALVHCKSTGTPGLFLQSLPKSLVGGVICGWNVADDVHRRLHGQLAEPNPALRLGRAYLENGSISFSPPLDPA